MARTILLADDSKTIQRAVEIVFDKEPYDVISVGNGADAIARAKEIRPAIVLADHLMPGSSGYEVAAALRDDPSTASVPVVLLTGSASPFDEAKAQASGVAATIKKPFDCQSLINRVDELLGGRADDSLAAMPPSAVASMTVPTAPTAPGVPVAPTSPPAAAVSPTPPPSSMASPTLVPQTPVSATSPLWSSEPETPAVAATPVAATPVASTPVAPVASTPVAPVTPVAATPVAATPIAATPVAATPAAATPVAAVAAQATSSVVAQASAAIAATGESPNSEAVSAAAREIIERVVWEVVPELAETLIKEEIARLMKSR